MGLAVGLGCCFLIALFVRHELSYDQFHENADKIYRVESDWRPAGGNISLASVNYPFVNVLKTEYSEFEIATLTRASANGAVRRGDQVFCEEGILYANNAPFDVFSFELEQGDEETALSEPYTVVLTHEMAEKYFGEENPIGQTLEFSKLPESISFHNLHHSCASWMVMQGAPISVVQHVLGHSDIQVTQRYAHLAPDVMRKAMQETFAV